MTYTVTFWGTRGSIPTPGAGTSRYGGNTPCVAVEGAAGQLVVLDAGTGIRALGLDLVAKQNGAAKVEILLSHAHWDHDMGRRPSKRSCDNRWTRRCSPSRSTPCRRRSPCSRWTRTSSRSGSSG